MKRILFLFLPFLPYLATAQVAKDTVTVLTLAQIPAGAIRDTTNLTFVQDNGFKKANFDSLAKYTRGKLQTYTLDSTHITASGLNLQGTRFTGVLPVTRGGTGNTTGLAATATALQNTRTIWGQNFNGAANVTGNLSGVGNITGTLRSGITSRNIHVSPIFAAMPGEGFADYGMVGVLYDRNELTNSAYTGSIEVTITGVGEYTNTTANKHLMANASGDFIAINNLTSTSIVSIVFDLGRQVDNFGDAKWQPFFQTRLGVTTLYTYPDTIDVEVSSDSITWRKPASGEWSINNFLTNTESVQNGLWTGLISSVPSLPSNRYRYARFTLKGFRIGTSASTELWISEMGIRHQSAAAAKQYLNQVGGNTAYGDQIFLNNVNIGRSTSQANYRVSIADSVYVGGNVSAAAYTTRSDYELKENIQDVGYGIQEVMQLQPVKYTYKSSGAEQLGFIAQDLGVVLPEVVSFDDNMAVFYNSIIPVLTKAIQEQQAQIEQLKQRITQLENK